MKQEQIDSLFDRTSGYWSDVYTDDSHQAIVYRQRQALMLKWVDALRLPSGTNVLEVGCGAGVATVELARRGFDVHAVDSSSEMVNTTAQRIAEKGLTDVVTVGAADVHTLPYQDSRFPLVVALGVLPWLHSPGLAVEELARVVTPGGHVILTADNRWRLNWLFEPAENPFAVPFKYARRGLMRLRGRKRSSARSALHRRETVDRMLLDAGLEPVRRATVGYGPFTFRWSPIFSDRMGLWLDRRLARLAVRWRPLRRAGWHYVVCARRPA